MKACWNLGNTNPHLPLIGRFWNGIDASSTAELTETKPSVWNHWEIMGKARNLSRDSGKDMLRIASLSTNLKHQSILIVGRTFKIQISKNSEKQPAAMFSVELEWINER